MHTHTGRAGHGAGVIAEGAAAAGAAARGADAGAAAAGAATRGADAGATCRDGTTAGSSRDCVATVRGESTAGVAWTSPGVSPDLLEALEVLDAHRLVQVGLRRCHARVHVLAVGGAVSGGDGVADRTLDRALQDRRLLGAMRGDLRGSLARLRHHLRRPVVEALIAHVPLARLQHDVFVDRMCGESWPRIAAARTGGDRGTAVRAFRQAGMRVQATAAVIAALTSGHGGDVADLARRTGLTPRMVNRVQRQLDAQGANETRRASQLPPSLAPPSRAVSVRGPSTPIRRAHGNRPNPEVGAEPCRIAGAEGNAGNDEASHEVATWRVLQVRPGFELTVKVGLERTLGDGVRCRTLRFQPGRQPLAGYLEVACRDRHRLQNALAGLAGVVGWIGAGSAPSGASVSQQRSGAQAALMVRDTTSHSGSQAAAEVAAWLDPRRGRP